MTELLFRLLFPSKAKQIDELREHLLNVVLFPHKNEVIRYITRIRSDYFEARSAGLQDAFIDEKERMLINKQAA